MMTKTLFSKKPKKRKSGFSLLETAFIVIIVSTLAAITIPAYQKTLTENENRSTRLLEAQEFANNRVVKSQTGEYPDDALITRLDDNGNIITTDTEIQPDYVAIIEDEIPEIAPDNEDELYRGWRKGHRDAKRKWKTTDKGKKGKKSKGDDDDDDDNDG